MKANILYFSIFILLISNTTFAQGEAKPDKAVLEKEWKKKLKAVPPLELKKVSDEYKELQRKNGKLNAEMKGIANELDAKDAQAQNMRKQIDSIKTARAGKSMAMEENESDITEKRSHCTGTVFKVQLGVTQNIDGSFRENGKNYQIEEDTDGRLVYSLGCFRDRDEAMTFQDQLKDIKVQDVYVVLYKDGKRSDVQEVQETNESVADSEEDEYSGDDW